MPSPTLDEGVAILPCPVEPATGLRFEGGRHTGNGFMLQVFGVPLNECRKDIVLPSPEDADVRKQEPERCCTGAARCGSRS